ncbi:MAG: serine/threonine protein kinase [Planctomycetes bacterium]|nr:serine/threonine protein kinase [Planctomycetota bacterium]
MARRKKRSFTVPSTLGPCTGLRKIGEGAMGAVFRGNHSGMGLDVAVKVLNPKLGKQDPVAVKRFVREVRALAALNDPHVIRVFDAGQQGPYTFAIMELIRGQSLDKILLAEPGGRLTPEAAAWYVTKIARGLIPVHASGIIHRDIKPENVMVDTHGGTKIADFGLARSEDGQNLTMADQIVGTPEYMAPELVAQQGVTGQADLYSLGICAYELLAGETPFHTGTLLQIVQAHLREEPAPLRSKNPNVSPELEAAIHKLLAKDPRQRYLTAEEVATAFEPFAQSTPPHKPEPDPEPTDEGQSMVPPIADLYLVKLLVQHRIYPVDTLLDGLVAKRKMPGTPLAKFLVERAGLPLQTAQQAAAAANNQAIGLRNHLGFQILTQSGRLQPNQTQFVNSELRPGQPLDAYLVQRGFLPQAEAEDLKRRVDALLEQGVQRSTQLACQQLGAPVAPLAELEARYTPSQFNQVYRLTLKHVVEQI